MTLSARLSGAIRISASPGLEAVTAVDKDAQCRQLLEQKTTHSAIQNQLLPKNTSHDVFCFFFFFGRTLPGLQHLSLPARARTQVPGSGRAREIPLSVFYTQDWGEQFVFPA